MYTGMDIGNGHFEAIPIDYNAIITGEQEFTKEQLFKINKYAKDYDDLEAPYNFTYAYAITVHKSQGSEWDKILLMEENFPSEQIEHRRWLYTGITRATKKLVVIRR